MKNFRFLLALVVVVTMLSTVAMAAVNVNDVSFSFNVPGNAISYTDGSIDFAVKTDTAIASWSATFAITFDNTKWDISATGNDFSGQVGVNGNKINVSYLSGADFTTAGDVVRFTATPKAGVDVGTSTFVLNCNVDSDDFEDYATYTKSETITVTKTVAPPAEPTVDTATVSEGYTTVNGTNGTIYNNVWVGEYSATAEDGAALTSMTVSFKDGAKVFDVAEYKTVEGEATLEFSIALIGVPTTENLAGTVAATAAWAN